MRLNTPRHAAYNTEKYNEGLIRSGYGGLPCDEFAGVAYTEITDMTNNGLIVSKPDRKLNIAVTLNLYYYF